MGVKLFSWMAAILFALGAIYFFKVSVERGWVSPPIRLALGLAAGIGFLVGCELKAARRYPVTANALDAAGVTILFSTFFAAHALWHLITALSAFLLLALVTAVAVGLSIRRESIFIALLGLFGGFATPALLSTGEDRPIGLFSYLLLLNVGLAWVAYRKRWPFLVLLALIFTTLYQWAWVIKFLSAPKLPLALGIFLLFPIVSALALVLGERGAPVKDVLFGGTAAWSAGLPLLFAVYLAAVPAYGERPGLLFGFLFLLDAGLAVLAAVQGPEALHLVGGGSTLLVGAVYLGASYTSGAWPTVLFYFTSLALLYLLAPFVLERLGRGFRGPGRRGIFMASLLVFVFPALVALEPEAAAPALTFGVLFAWLAAVAAVAIAREEGALHFLAAFLALAAEALWSARYLTPERLLPALGMYGGFALFYLGVPLAARRFGKRLKPEGSGSILLFASLALLFFLAAGPVAQAALWGMALLLLVLNLGLLLEASMGHLPVLTLAGMVLSWIVIAVWWATARLAAFLVPALVVVGGFAIVAVGGSLWARQRAEAEGRRAAADTLEPGVFLGLAGHLFLLFVASQASLAVPPWPLLGVLAVLDLAIGAAALYTRRGALHVAALAASQVVLLVWQGVAVAAPWPRVAILAAGAVAAFGLVWYALSLRVHRPAAPGGDRSGAAADLYRSAFAAAADLHRSGFAAAADLHRSGFAAAASAALVLAQVVAIFAGSGDGAPALTFLATAHVLLLVALLALAAVSSWHQLALVAVFTTAAAGGVYAADHAGAALWAARLFFALPLYLILVANPLVLGARGKERREPYLAAVLAGVPFFFVARQALLDAGYGDRIGLLPLAQAALLAVLLANVRRLGLPAETERGRLALVAGAALGFITVAIPLQLDKEWITIGWALLGAALAWLYTRVPHKGLLLWTVALFAAVFVRLVFNRAVLDYHPRGHLPIWNWYLYTYVVPAAALFLAARFLRGRDDEVGGFLKVASVTPAAGAVLLFLLVNIEIADFYSEGPTLTFNFFSAGLAQDLTYTLGWALFAIGLLVAGLLRSSRSVRIASLALFVVTILKCFLHDLGRLGGLYRVGSIVGLAVCLALVALLLQKFVLRPREEPR